MIAIAGAGIGGLTLGRALAYHGIPFRIFERAPGLRPAGAGIALADNALRALAQIGLDGAVRGAGLQLRRAGICDSAGRVITGSGELPFPVAVMPRTVLQQTLLDTIAPHVECARAVSAYAQHPHGVTVRFGDGSVMRAALLIAADGLHSQIREAMRGPEPLRYSGQTSWRAIASIQLADHARMTEGWGAGPPIRDRADARRPGVLVRRGGRAAGGKRSAIVRLRSAGSRMPVPRRSDGSATALSAIPSALALRALRRDLDFRL